MDLVPLVGVWGQVEAHGGSSQPWCVTSPSTGVCVSAVGRVKLGRGALPAGGCV